jgi:hypothetical protein
MRCDPHLVLRRFLEAAKPGGSTDPFAQVRELDPYRARRLGEEAGRRHARQGIHL